MDSGNLPRTPEQKVAGVRIKGHVGLVPKDTLSPTSRWLLKYEEVSKALGTVVWKRWPGAGDLCLGD